MIYLNFQIYSLRKFARESASIILSTVISPKKQVQLLRQIYEKRILQNFLYSIIECLIIREYNQKFFAPCLSVITEMSRSFIIDGNQTNPAFYESDALVRIVIICTLILVYDF